MKNQRDRICLSCLLAGCISLPKATSGQSDAAARTHCDRRVREDWVDDKLRDPGSGRERLSTRVGRTGASGA